MGKRELLSPTKMPPLRRGFSFAREQLASSLRKKILDPRRGKNLMLLIAAARLLPALSEELFGISPGSSDSGAVRVAFVRVMLYATSMELRELQKGEIP